MSFMTDRTDAITTIFYMGPGMVVTGVLFQIIQAIRRARDPTLPDYTSKGQPHEGVWHPHNIIKDGQFNGLNLVRFAIQVLLFLLNVSSILLCMHYAHLGGVNVGVMTAIWGVQPLFAAFLDWLIYKEPFLLSYAIGIVMMIFCAIAVAFKAPEEILIAPVADVNIKITVEGFPVWPAILLGFITPCVFCAQALYNKHVTAPHVGFDAATLSFGSSSIAGGLLTIVSAAWYFQYVVTWDPTLFWVGLGAAILDTIGKAFIQRAFAAGPAGIVGAFVEINNVLLVIIEAVREQRVPSGLEFVSFIFAMVGALWFVIPGQLYWIIG
jgi:drug/metabolite transporter (DMT)-like permease